MKKDAHYYAVLAFARACGFKKEAACSVAYASQFVDDAKINYITLKEKPASGEFEIIDNKPALFNMATCHSYFKVKTFNFSSMTNNTCAFHFVPGCEGSSFVKKMRCKENKQVINNILRDAKEEDDLVKFGMVLHPFADTFVHKGFSGILSKVNDIQKCKPRKISSILLKPIIRVMLLFGNKKFDKYLDSAMPAYGHGQAMENPDLPYLEWSYEYDYTDEFSEELKPTNIDNKKRFKRAFENIKQHLEEYLTKHPEYKDDNVNFTDFGLLHKILIKQGSDKKRIKNWKKLLLETKLFLKSDVAYKYDENLWLKQAFSNFDKKKFNERKVTNAVLTNNFNESNWYKFYKAVKWYKTMFFKYCKEEGLDIPNKFV
ncbi:MAG: hypothetical protein HQ554_07115 [FCB group bacterium]|nr:hypothetical protein [FCB group bacterium]